MRYSFTNHKTLYFTAVTALALSILLLVNRPITKKEAKSIHIKTERQLESGLWQKMDDYSATQSLIIAGGEDLKLPEFEIQVIPPVTEAHALTATFIARCKHQELFSVSINPITELITEDKVISFGCMNTRWRVSLVQ
jgi:hypothetical protein